ncbi:YafY family protein [Alisedimentitalea sp. MJ-SS2]|uniref:helix-turn-helix transcriptional regulator n=1 Tax=Aliisedimentitalea sp. MJ-SS2 TaxID=3049795 RepID=UPI00290DD9EC|nr:YafY family protein [Alisedimentitalea sp. MJ-SS2]MDU8929549.1 YafY family protein [Alisedimentitalea sp. MJ-SS2]
MPRSDRLFELIQLLRAARGPSTADVLAEELEVSPRTIYRDIAALQAMRVPVEGAAGLGYVLRGGYDLPPLNFDAEEAEALRVGLSMLARTGDSALQRAAKRVCAKVDALHGPADWLYVAPWGAPTDDPDQGCVSIARLRQAIRDEEKLVLRYQDEMGEMSSRTVRPIVVIYHLNCTMLAAWCELRAGFRHFRTDRIFDCRSGAGQFVGQGSMLRKLWAEQETVAADTPLSEAEA